MTDEPGAPSTSLPRKYWVVIVLIIGVAAGYFALPTHKHECGSGPANDAYLNLRRLYDAQVSYFKTTGGQFVKSTALTPGKPTEIMCDGTEHEGFLADDNTWSSPSWKALNFAILKRSHYAYEMETAGTGKSAHFTVRVLGDLDCDGIMSTHEITGRVDADTPSEVIGRHAVYTRNPDE